MVRGVSGFKRAEVNLLMGISLRFHLGWVEGDIKLMLEGSEEETVTRRCPGG